MPSKLVDPDALPTMTFDWGLIKPLIATENTDAPEVSLMHVVLLPGQGHERHNHPGSDEILYILSGHGEQMVDDDQTFPVGAGQAVFIPKGAYHSTVNTGWEPLALLAIYAPAGAEEVLKTLPDHREVAPGEAPRLVRR
ncbi:MAG TPA: cupin domain-containing protein [Solirubrobacteraceae bacterium]|nr:cupin domain-containing protein [Solirubrobacteraceae bacterium]